MQVHKQPLRKFCTLGGNSQRKKERISNSSSLKFKHFQFKIRAGRITFWEGGGDVGQLILLGFQILILYVYNRFFTSKFSFPDGCCIQS